MTTAAQNSKQLLTPKGSAATPSHSFLGNNTTGWYLSATNEMSAATNGTQRFVIDSSGNVGIGTSSPTSYGSPLAVYAASNSTLAIASGNANAYLKLFTTSDNNMYLTNTGGSMTMITANTERMRIDSSGNVGIGTASPTSATNYRSLCVNGTSGSFLNLFANGSWVGGMECDLNNVYVESVTSIPLLFRTNSTERMRIDSSGNVGIGTTSPSSYGLLTVLSTTAGSAKINIMDNSAGSAAPLLQFGVNSSNGFNTSDAARVWTTASASNVANLNFAAYNGGAPSTAQMVLTGGNVGIGTSSPGNRLHLYGSTNATSGISIQNTGGSGRRYTIYSSTAGGLYFANDTGGGDQMVLDASGNLLVGTTSSDARLTVKGSGTTSGTYTTKMTNSAGTVGFQIRDDGFVGSPMIYANTNANAANLVITSDGYIYRSTSSLKYKRDVQDATHGLAELMQLRPVTYKGNAKSDSDKILGGLIAEEVHAAGLTEFVQYAEDGSPDALAYGNMVSLCIKAIQELSAQVTSLKAEIDTLKGTK